MAQRLDTSVGPVSSREIGARSRLIKSLPAVLVLFCLIGWTKPYRPPSERPVSDPKARLDMVILEVSGSRRSVKNHEEITLVRGDKIVIKSALLTNGQISTGALNLVGFTSAEHPGIFDQDATIDTNVDLVERWSERGEGLLYVITAVEKGRLQGEVYLRLTEPTLNYAVLSINGATRVMRDGELLQVLDTDMVKVERVETNVEPLTDVLFQIGPEHIRFLRGSQVFAEIPLQLRTAAGSKAVPVKPRKSPASGPENAGQEKG